MLLAETTARSFVITFLLLTFLASDFLTGLGTRILSWNFRRSGKKKKKKKIKVLFQMSGCEKI
jgi:hypothetical protein